MIEAARAGSSRAGNPLSAVLTHAHGDHANGAGLVSRTGGEVIATETTAEDVSTGPHTYPSMFNFSDWGEITPPASIRTINEPTPLDLGNITVEIHPVPAHAHTGGDIVVWIPTDGVLFTGDLLFHGVTPLGLHGSITGWLDSLTWLESFGARHIVPGHGPLATPDSGLVATVRHYLRWILDAVSGPAEPDFAQLAEEATQRWSSWLDAERHIVNIRAAHAEVREQPFDTTAAVNDMLAVAGGRIDLHI